MLYIYKSYIYCVNLFFRAMYRPSAYELETASSVMPLSLSTG